MAEPSTPQRSQIFDRVIQRGAPKTPLRDLYHDLMRGSWAYVVGLIALSYMMANLTFAGLYLAGGDCIENAKPGSFADAFFFSVQTISTIGYGTLAPKTLYANLIVTVEAIVGLLGFALAAGLMFSKFSLPRAKVMFSSNAIVTTYHGKPALMFRVANLRGNDVVSAKMQLTLLKSEISPEGHRMRKVHELPLVRERTPLFRLSWLAIHPIDEHSELEGETAQSMADDNMVLIVSLTGLDGTFSQTVYARHGYFPADILWGARFVDSIEIREDGRPVFDYTKFHLTEREPDRGLAERRPRD